MTLCVVSSNEDAQQQQSDGSIGTMEANSWTEDQKSQSQSQDSGYASQPSSSATKYLGQNLRITACANQGGRKYMEDRVHVRVHRNPSTGEIDWTYVAVYDGHGGPEASEYCRQHLLKNIQAQKGFDSEDDDEFLEAIRSGFLMTHHTMWKEVDNWARTASGYPSTAGTTASCAFIRRGKVYVGHVGDSAILLTTRSHSERFYRLTEDHKPELAKERKRIEASGGQIMQKQSIFRVVWTRATHGHVGPIRKSTPVQTIPFLAVARSLGDFWSYIEETQEFAVSPIPDVSVIKLTPDHHSIILASDGLTNVMSPELEAAMMYELAAEEQQKLWFTEANEQPNHARILMRRTMLNWRHFRADNVSVLAVVFDDKSDSSCSSSSTEEYEEDCSSIDQPVEVPKEADVDSQLAEHPLCMLHVTNERMMRYQTAPVALRYKGLLDDRFHAVDSVGPGFVSHDTERASIEDADDETADRTDKLMQYYDILGRGERDVTPENQPPPTSTYNLTNTVTIGGGVPTETKPIVFTSAAAMIIDELRRGGDATAAAAASAAAAVVAAEGAEERPATPENKPNAGIAVLRTSRSSIKRKSRMFSTEEDSTEDSAQPSTSSPTARPRDHDGEKEKMEESESESSADDVAIKMSLPFADQMEDREVALRTPSPLGDTLEERDHDIRSTPPCNMIATEREMVKRVTRSASATISVSSLRETIVVERPTTRRSLARRVQDGTAAAASPAISTPRTPKMILQVDEVLTSVASRTRSRNGEMTPPRESYTPLKSASGSRKRPRTAISSDTTTTPLLARISLTEKNENAESSMESDMSAKAGTSNKSESTDSRWVPIPCEATEGGEEIGREVFYEVHPTIDDDDHDGEPLAKRLRTWGMGILKRLFPSE